MKIAWDSLDRQGYERLFAAAGKTPLTQCWAYGEAKRAERLKVRRFVISDAGEPVALGQVLAKGFLVHLLRLNRGPVWLRPAGPADWRVALKLLRWPLSPMLIAPETGDAQAVAHLRRRGGPAWSSAWLDLRPDPELLRKGLNGKWRNMLVNAEKAGLAVAPGSIERLIEEYRAFQQERAFSGISPALLSALHRNAPEDMLILEAREGENAVAGILLARHGAAATYLIGWNSEAGRKARANYLLLWQAMLAARARGLQWLDLGGIDEAGTPGIASFKRGLNGEAYTLAGEFLAL